MKRKVEAVVGGIKSQPPSKIQKVTSSSSSKTKAKVIKTWFPFVGTGVYKKETNELMPLAWISHEIHVDEFCARVRKSFLFENVEEQPVELIYKFTLGEDSVPVRVTAEVYDPKTGKTKHLVSVVKEKEKAREMYDDVVAEGNVGIIMEMESKESPITLMLGNIQKKNQVKIKVEYIQEMIIESFGDEDEKSYVKFQLEGDHVGKDYGKTMTQLGHKAVDNVDVKGIVKLEKCNVRAIRSDSHASLLKVKKDGNEYGFEITKKISNSASFNLIIELGEIPLGYWHIEKKTDKLFTHMVSLHPNFKSDENVDEEVRSEIIVLIDRSGSMSGSRMAFARTAMKLFFQSLDPDSNVSVNIVSFGSNFTSFYKKPRKFDEKVLKECIDHVKDMKADYGGTNILSPIQNILKDEVKHGWSKQVFLLTDGEDSQSQKIIDFVSNFSDTTRIFAFGIGNGINPVFLDSVAKASNGYSVFITNNDEINEKVLFQLKRAMKPALTNVNLKFPGGCNIKSVCEGKPPILFNNQRKLLYFISDGLPSSNTLEMKCLFKEKEMNTKLSYELKGKQTVGYFCAQRRLQHLEKTKKTKDKEYTSLALQFGLLSTNTSFIMTTTNEEAANGEMKEIVIPSVVYKPINEPKKKRRNLRSWGNVVGGGRGGRGKGRGKGGMSRNRSRGIGFQKEMENSFFDPHSRSLLANSMNIFPVPMASTQSINSNHLLGSEDDSDSESCDSFSFASAKIQPRVEIKQKKKKKKGKKKLPKLPEKIDLSGLLLGSDIKGIFKSCDEVFVFLKLKKAEVLNSKPSNISDEFWITSIIIAVLQMKFLRRKSEWELIIKKSIKSLKKNKQEALLELGKKFVREKIYW